MRLEEEAVGTRHGRGREQRRNEFALPSAGAARPLPRLLHGVGRVEDHRRARGRREPREIAHVHHEVTVAEEGPALGDRDVRAAAAPHLLERARHRLRPASIAPS